MHLVWKLLQKEEALPYLCDWEYGAAGWEKQEKSCQNAYPTGWETKKSADDRALYGFNTV